MALEVGVGLRAWQARTLCIPADLGVDDVSYARTTHGLDAASDNVHVCFNEQSLDDTKRAGNTEARVEGHRPGRAARDRVGRPGRTARDREGRRGPPTRKAISKPFIDGA